MPKSTSQKDNFYCPTLLQLVYKDMDLYVFLKISVSGSSVDGKHMFKFILHYSTHRMFCKECIF